MFALSMIAEKTSGLVGFVNFSKMIFILNLAILKI